MPFVSLCVYSFTVITYAAPLAAPSMVLGLLALFIGNTRVRFPLPLALYTLFLAWALSGLGLSNHPDIVAKTLQEYAKIGLIALLAYSVLNDRARLRFFIFLLLGAYALYPVRGAIFNYFIYHASEQGRTAWNGLYSNPNDLAAFLLLPLGLALGVAVSERNAILRACAAAGMVLMPFVIFITGSRGGQLAMFLLALLALLSRRRKRLQYVAAVAAAAGVAAFFVPAAMWVRLTSLTKATGTSDLGQLQDEGSAKQRYEIWKVGATITREHPIFGVGVGTYPYEHMEYARRGAFNPTARGPRDTHSTYIHLSAENGIPGAIIFLSIFVVIGVRADGVRRRLLKTDPMAADQLAMLEFSLLAVFMAAIFGSYDHIVFIHLHGALVWTYATVHDPLRSTASQALPSRRRAVAAATVVPTTT